MRKPNIVVLLLALALGSVLCFQLRASAQNTDPCAECDNALFDGQFHCDSQYATCTGGDADAPGFVKLICEFERAFCMAETETTWNSCRASCRIGGGSGGGGNPTGKEPSCVNQCFQFEEQCYAGSPLDWGGVYSTCIDNGGLPETCCNQERDYCIDNCPPAYQP